MQIKNKKISFGSLAESDGRASQVQKSRILELAEDSTTCWKLKSVIFVRLP